MTFADWMVHTDFITAYHQWGDEVAAAADVTANLITTSLRSTDRPNGRLLAGRKKQACDWHLHSECCWETERAKGGCR